MRKIMKYIVLGLLIILVMIQGLYIVVAHMAASRVEVLSQGLGTLKFGANSLPDSVGMLRSRGVAAEAELCSRVAASCDGLNVRISSYPEFRSPRWRKVSRSVAHISLIQPSTVQADLYFVDGRLHSVITKFERSDWSVGVSEDSTDQGLQRTVDWRGYQANGGVKAIRARLFKPFGSSPDILQQFDLRWITSVRRCDDARNLWPSAPLRTKDTR